MRLRRLLEPQWLALHAFAIVVIGAFCWLGWWQLSRYEWGGGDLQNLGYALQWPLFAGFVVFFWWRLIHEPTRSGTDDDADTAGTQQTPTVATPIAAIPKPARVRRRAARHPAVRTREPAPQRTAEDLPADAFDDVQTGYNRYLAALHAADESTARTQPARSPSPAQPARTAPDTEETHR